MKKTIYEQPTTKVFVVRVEGCLCGSDPLANGTRQGNVLNSGDYDFDEWD